MKHAFVVFGIFMENQNEGLASLFATFVYAGLGGPGHGVPLVVPANFYRDPFLLSMLEVSEASLDLNFRSYP